MNDYNTAKQYLTALKNELLRGQSVLIKEPELSLCPSNAGELHENLNSQLIEENDLLKKQVNKLKDELELIRGTNEEVVNELNQKLEEKQKELIEERAEASLHPKDNGLYVSLDSILEWAAEQHNDGKDITLIQNMIYDRFELTAEGKEMVRTLKVKNFRQIIIQHADQVIGVAEKDSNIAHTKTS